MRRKMLRSDKTCLQSAYWHVVIRERLNLIIEHHTSGFCVVLTDDSTWLNRWCQLRPLMWSEILISAEGGKCERDEKPCNEASGKDGKGEAY